MSLFLANFTPSPCHTLSHIPEPPQKVYLRPPIFSRPSTKNLDQKPSLQILSQLFTGFFQGVFSLEGFVRGGFVRSPSGRQTLSTNSLSIVHRVFSRGL